MESICQSHSCCWTMTLFSVHGLCFCSRMLAQLHQVDAIARYRDADAARAHVLYTVRLDKAVPRTIGTGRCRWHERCTGDQPILPLFWTGDCVWQSSSADIYNTKHAGRIMVEYWKGTWPHGCIKIHRQCSFDWNCRHGQSRTRKLTESTRNNDGDAAHDCATGGCWRKWSYIDCTHRVCESLCRLDSRLRSSCRKRNALGWNACQCSWSISGHGSVPNAQRARAKWRPCGSGTPNTCLPWAASPTPWCVPAPNDSKFDCRGRGAGRWDKRNPDCIGHRRDGLDVASSLSLSKMSCHKLDRAASWAHQNVSRFGARSACAPVRYCCCVPCHCTARTPVFHPSSPWYFCFCFWLWWSCVPHSNRVLQSQPTLDKRWVVAKAS